MIKGDKEKTHFLHYIEKTELKPYELAVVGDRLKKEIKIGNKLGMKTIWFQSGKFASELPETEEEKPVHIITHLLEVLEIE